MWTFTIDPSLFVSPAAAYQYVKDNRCISRTMRELRRGGFLHSRRYVVFVEWQKETEMPHWHVLADASFVPFNAVCDIWNRFRPISAGPVHGERPGFGSIRFTAPKFKSPTHAARYGCKYLIKYPEHGYPAWVLASHDVHRFSTSRGFWPTGEELREQSTEIGPGVVVEEQEFPPVDEARDNDVEPLEKRPRTTIAERLAGCGEASVVLRIASVVDMATGEVREVRRFVGRVEMPLRDCAAYLGRSLPDRQRRLELMEAEAMNLFTCKRSLNGVERQLSHFSRVTRSVPIGDWCSTALDNDVMHGVIHTLWMLKTTSRC
ncbi:MAG TPA: hypothetical protein VMD30_10415 [Tepidisphaeraceae bacterium]|nr:hypothetical protein [Tepidisphaeraceae bacterium]